MTAVWLAQLSPDQQKLLVRLPYRVGAFVSSSDSTGGMEADVQEKLALRTLLTAYVQDTLKSPQVQALMEATIQHQPEWPQWLEGLETVPAECREAIDLLSEFMHPKELGAFKSNLIEIAITVALAFREIDVTAVGVQKLSIYGRLWLERWQAFIQGRAMTGQDEILNVSAAEKAALQQIGRALDRDVEIGGTVLSAAG